MKAILLIASTAATAVAESAQPGSSDWISGSTLIAIISAICGAGGVVGGRVWGESSARKVKAEIPQPCIQEQSPSQANWKTNEHDHENLFNRVAKAEKDIARIEAKTDATFQFVQKQLDALTQMTTQIFNKLIKGDK